MANTAYLMATAPGVISPSVRDGFNEETQILARSAGTVPLLWLAMFRPADLVTDTIEVDEVIKRELADTEDDDDLVNALLTAMGGGDDAIEAELIDDEAAPGTADEDVVDAEVVDDGSRRPRLDEVLDLHGETAEATAPVATAQTCRAQLEAAGPVLSRVFGEDAAPYVAMMAELLDGLGSDAVTIELDELEDEREEGEYQAELRMALACFDDPGDVEETAALLRDLSGLDDRPWPSARLLVDDIRDVPRDDFRNHARLLGESWERPVPWERDDEH